MLNEYGSDRDSRFMVDTFDWIWVPVANPDGYQYTHDLGGVSTSQYIKCNGIMLFCCT